MGDLKHRKYLNTTLPIEMINAIENLHTKTGIPKSRLAEEAFELLFKKRKIKYTKIDPGK